ncbi:hypothetical protein roselon_02854 [Roseibacterium elongatum DSM 19469]|uniref:Methyltransferase FkbM domain-containing protein n=1 Tax=Roseicyclus elongatus DSM 19469 TaxID=1294273 RepID=W8S4L1_9RHOB|nr:FkbM family methyltransferase [Roseibacterium elongatum]AHM05152.1 hypothetical protein roselon_02854 [Roseibacterium elongatum DSM 19469]
MTRVEPTRRVKSLALQLLFEIADQWTEGRAFCVQVGANDGVIADPLNPFLTKRGWGGLLMEPNPLYFRRAEALHADNDRVTVRNIGCSSEPGTLPLYHLGEAHEHLYRRNARGTASLDRAWLHDALAKESEVFDESHIAVTEVQLDRLDDILAREGVTRADVLVIDVEGHEAEVLAGLDLLALNPVLARVECTDRKRTRALMPVLAAGGRSVYKIAGELIALAPELREAIEVDHLLQTLGLGAYTAEA